MKTDSSSSGSVRDRLRTDVWISGQALSEALRCTRTAIWKQVQILRRQGYAVEARPRLGYRLIRPPEAPLPAEVQPLLTTARLGRDLVWLPSVDSTNRWLAGKADAGAPDGLVAAADVQTAGRGRLDRAWCSPPGKNLSFSVLLRPAVPLDRVASLSLLLGLAVRRALLAQEPGLDPRLKWPNDIWIEGRKLCGILCEMRAEPDRVRHVVAGIGLNVNSEAADFPPDLRPVATSLKIATGRTFSRAGILAAILNALEPMVQRWERDGLTPFLDELAQADMLKGQPISLDQGMHTLSGRADGIAPDGALRLSQPGGHVRIAYSGDVHVRRIAGLRSLVTIPLGLTLASVILASPATSPVIDVTASRLDRNAYPSSYGELSLAEQAASIPGARLVRQGRGSPQADLRIRGGAFSSSGFALEGLPLYNPQTEHFHADLPVAPLWAGSVNLLTGIEQFQAFSGHASGTIDVELAEPEDHLKCDMTAGSDGLWAPAVSAGWRTPAPAGPIWGGSVFVEHDQIDKTDGYSDNALSRWSGGAQVQQTDAARTSRSTLLGTLSTRRFGARGFYGAPAQFPAEEELSELLLLGSLRTLDANAPSRLTAAWQRSDDRYWLDRDDQALYANHTVSDSAALHADDLTRFSPVVALHTRLDWNEERIDGDYAGRLPSAGLGDYSRSRLAAAALPEWTLGDAAVFAGAGGEWFDSDKPAWLPAAGISWTPAVNHTLYAALSSAVRQPSFTELNYESPGSLGNRDLQRQESIRGETGWTCTEADSTIGVLVFTDQARRVVDWIQTEPESRWTAVNLGAVKTWGLLAHARRALGERWTLNGEYMALDKHADEPVYASRYALDYARHEFRAGIRAAPVPNWRFGFWQTAGFAASNPARNSGTTSLESNLEAQFRISRYGAMVSAGLANLWDDDFEALPGQPVSGRQVYLSASLAL